MLKHVAHDRGWVSAELALVTPALVFLACVLGAVVAISGDRAQLVLAAHNAVLSAMRGETDDSVRVAAALALESVELSQVQVTRQVKSARNTVSVCVIATRQLPAPLAALDLTWRECASSITEP